jgi:ribosome-associated heat shock protein Hsp15
MDQPRQALQNTEQRIDKWLWFARVAKTRTLAAALVTEGRVRINGVRCEKSSHVVRPGDVLTISAGGRVRVLEVVAGGARRGPPLEAQALLIDRSPAPPPRPARSDIQIQGQRRAGAGRPTKRERREIDRLTRDEE